MNRNRALVAGVLLIALLGGCSAAPSSQQARPAGPPTSTAPAAPRVAELPASAPDTVTLPPGFAPEGIAVGPDNVGYLVERETGAIYRVDLATGKGSLLSPATGHPGQGTKLDKGGRLYVTGADAGDARVVDSRDGRELAHLGLVAKPTEDNNLVNDGLLTSDAWWLTDSRNPVLYRIALPPDGSVPTQGDVSTVKLTGDLKYSDGINANGIAATPDGKGLLVVQSNTGNLFRVDPESGRTTQVQLGGVTLDDGDGLLLDGQTLYVAQNDPNTLTVLQLDPTGARGRLTQRINDPKFDKPTTIVKVGARLYLPNARFDVDPTPTTRYTVVSLPIS